MEPQQHTLHAWLAPPRAGPELELEHWRSRSSRLAAAAEQLQGAEHRCVAAVCTAAGVPACARWRQLEAQLADGVAEAQETVKYLGALDASLQCIYTSEPLLFLPPPPHCWQPAPVSLVQSGPARVRPPWPRSISWKAQPALAKGTLQGSAHSCQSASKNRGAAGAKAGCLAQEV
jgi:hypothetical protein